MDYSRKNKPYNTEKPFASKVLCQHTFGNVTYVGTSSGNIIGYNWKTGGVGNGYTVHEGPITSFTFNRDRSLMYSGSWDKYALKWDTKTRKPCPNFQKYDHGDFVECVLLSGDESILYTTCANGKVSAFNAATGELLASDQVHIRKTHVIKLIGYINDENTETEEDNSVKADSDDKNGKWKELLLTCASDRKAKFVVYSNESHSFTTLFEMPEHITNVVNVWFKCGYLFLTCSDKHLHVYQIDLANKASNEVRDFLISDIVHDIAFPTENEIWDLHGKLYLGCRDGSLQIWDLQNRKLERSIKNWHSDGIAAVEKLKQTFIIPGNKNEEKKEHTAEVIISGGWDFKLRRLVLNDSDEKIINPQLEDSDSELLTDSDEEEQSDSECEGFDSLQKKIDEEKKRKEEEERKNREIAEERLRTMLLSEPTCPQGWRKASNN